MLLDLRVNSVRIGAQSVEFVDKRKERYVVALHLTIDGERLTLYAADGAQHKHSAVEHAQRSFHFDSEIDLQDSLSIKRRGLCQRKSEARTWPGVSMMFMLCFFQSI